MTEKRNYIIFGGTGGIGSEVCKRLADRGRRLMIGARTESRLSELAQEIDAEYHVTDVTKSEEVQVCFERASELFGRVDGIVHCVGSVFLKPVHLISDEDWHETIDLNLHSAFYVLRGAARAMMKTGGSIVLMSSCAARVGLMNHEAIAAAKAGVIGLTLSAAATYAPRGIRVNCVAPGLVQTPLTEHITSNENALKVSEAMHPLGRVGKPQDIVPAIEWLLDPDSSWITGQVIGIDGGLATVRPR